VSENDDSHCTDTTKVEVTSHGKRKEEERKAFKRPRKTDIEGDVLRQTVPVAGGGNREGLIANSGQPCTSYDGQSAMTKRWSLKQCV